MRSSLRQASAELWLRHRVVSSVYLHLTDLCACVMVRLNSAKAASEVMVELARHG
jgi:hypothetical protein